MRGKRSKLVRATWVKVVSIQWFFHSNKGVTNHKVATLDLSPIAPGQSSCSYQILLIEWVKAIHKWKLRSQCENYNTHLVSVVQHTRELFQDNSQTHYEYQYKLDWYPPRSRHTRPFVICDPLGFGNTIFTTRQTWLFCFLKPVGWKCWP